MGLYRKTPAGALFHIEKLKDQQGGCEYMYQQPPSDLQKR